MEKYRSLLEQILFELLSLPTAPFREGKVLGYIKDYANRLGCSFDQDDMGNTVVTVGDGEDSTLAIEAHTDHPGFIIAEDSDGPRVGALFYGFVEEEYFEGCSVDIFNDIGIVGGKVVSTDFSQKAEQIKKVVLEIDGPVSKGDVGMWALDECRIEGDVVYSRAMDDLGGCAAILALMKIASERGDVNSFKAIFTVAEEAGFNGAKYLAASEKLGNDLNIITVETSSLLAGAPAGDGAVIRVGDRVSVFDNGLLCYMENCAKKIKKLDKQFRYQRKLMDGGACESSVYQKFGYRTAAVCVPLGNYHNRDVENKKIAGEWINLNDLAGLVKLLENMIDNSNGIDKFVYPDVPQIQEQTRGLGERIIKVVDNF